MNEWMNEWMYVGGRHVVPCEVGPTSETSVGTTLSSFLPVPTTAGTILSRSSFDAPLDAPRRTQHQQQLPNEQHSLSTTHSEVFLYESNLLVPSMHIRWTLSMVECVGQKQHVEAALLHNGSHVDG